MAARRKITRPTSISSSASDRRRRTAAFCSCWRPRSVSTEIEVGYGLEPVINDARAGDIGREMVPDLKQRGLQRRGSAGHNPHRPTDRGRQGRAVEWHARQAARRTYLGDTMVDSVCWLSSSCSSSSARFRAGREAAVGPAIGRRRIRFALAAGGSALGGRGGSWGGGFGGSFRRLLGWRRRIWGLRRIRRWHERRWRRRWQLVNDRAVE